MHFSEVTRERLVLTAVSDMLTILSDLEALDEVSSEEGDSARRSAMKVTLDPTTDDLRAFWLIYASLVVRSQRQAPVNAASGTIHFRPLLAVFRNAARIVPHPGFVVRRLAFAALTILLILAVASLTSGVGVATEPEELMTADAGIRTEVTGLVTANAAVQPQTGIVPALRPPSYGFGPGYGMDHPNLAGLTPPRLRARYDPPQAGM